MAQRSKVEYAGFYISLAAVSSGLCARLRDETAIVVGEDPDGEDPGRRFYILDGNHAEALNAAASRDGLPGAMRYFAAHLGQMSGWSHDPPAEYA